MFKLLQLRTAANDTARKQIALDKLNQQIIAAQTAAVSAAAQTLTAGGSILEATLDAMAAGIAECVAPGNREIANFASIAANQYREHPNLNKLIEITAKTANDAVTRRRVTASLEAAAAAATFAQHSANKAIDFIVDQTTKAVQRSPATLERNAVLQTAEAAATAAASMSAEYLKAKNAIDDADKVDRQPGQQATKTQVENRAAGQASILRIEKITEIATKIALQYANDPNIIAITATAVAIARKEDRTSPQIAAFAAAEIKSMYPNDPNLDMAAELAAITAERYQSGGLDDAAALGYARKIGAVLCTPLPTLTNGSDLPAGSVAISTQALQQTQQEARDLQEREQRAALALEAQRQQIILAEQREREANEREARARAEAMAEKAAREAAEERAAAGGGAKPLTDAEKKARAAAARKR